MKLRERRPWKRAALRLLISVALFAAGSAAARAGEPEPLVDRYGTPGLLDMPGAHMIPDGDLLIWASDSGFQRRFGITFQALPWFEGSFRYILTPNFGINIQGTYYDRSFGAKVRLQDEEDGWPDISVGLLDIVGTSFQSGEYVVASKHLGPFDATLGMGWGRLAGTGMFKNPFIYLFRSFANRSKPSGVAGTGRVQFGEFFHGPDASLFGGVTWQTPITGLSLIAEYSSDNYGLEASRGVFTPKMQFNAGASYQVADWAQLSAGWLNGSTGFLQLSVQLDPKTEPSPTRFGPKPLAANIRPDAPPAPHLAQFAMLPAPVKSAEIAGSDLIVLVQAKGAVPVCAKYVPLVEEAGPKGINELVVVDINDPRGNAKFCPMRSAGVIPASEIVSDKGDDSKTLRAARKQIIKLAGEQGIEIDALSFHGAQLDVAMTNSRYRTEPESYGRIARVMMAAAPPDIETFRLVSLTNGAPTRDLIVPRSSLERVIADRGSGAEIIHAISTNPAPPAPSFLSDDPTVSYPRFDWAILPEYNQLLFDPSQAYRFQLLMGLQGGVELFRGFRLEGEFQANVLDTFHNLQRSNSVLPHVRSDYDLYFDKGANGISLLQAKYTRTLAPGLYGMVRAGYLESMYAGAGGEVLWWQDGDRWALGASLYDVWQRGFDRLFDMRKYHILTGHVSFYYESPYHGLDLEIDAGRYLAGDYGATFQISRRFDTGVELGVFATLTNVPFSRFGEGSFDKGLVIHIPLDWVVPVDSQSALDMTLRPVTRDGGQALQGEEELYDDIRRTSYGDVIRGADEIVSP